MQHTEYGRGMPAPKPLPVSTQEQIMSTWNSIAPPLVSICCATYNHATYLEDALRGFLGQVTSFPFEIIVRDDASTDGTAEILRVYAEKFPKIIRAAFEGENQYSKGIRAGPALLSLAAGEFIALCEGDDYWITPDKLEKQVLLLRTHPLATMCVALTSVCKYNKDELLCERVISGNQRELVGFEDIKTTYFHTSTFLIKASIYREVLEEYLGRIELGDTALRYMLADRGPFVQLHEIVSVYRLTGSGIWTSLDRVKRLEWEIKATEGFYEHFSSAHRAYFGERLFILYMQMAREGVMTFGKRSSHANVFRLICFAAKYGATYYLGHLWQRFANKLHPR